MRSARLRPRATTHPCWSAAGPDSPSTTSLAAPEPNGPGAAPSAVGAGAGRKPGRPGSGTGVGQVAKLRANVTVALQLALPAGSSRNRRRSTRWHCRAGRHNRAVGISGSAVAAFTVSERTSPRSFGREWRADGREGVLQRVDVAGRVHRARGAQGRPGCAALDGATAYLGYRSFVTNLTNFLDVLLVIFIPWSAVNLADYFLVRRGPLRRRLVLHRRRCVRPVRLARPARLRHRPGRRMAVRLPARLHRPAGQDPRRRGHLLAGRLVRRRHRLPAPGRPDTGHRPS